MTDFEKNGNYAELSSEALEKASGGASGTRRLRIIKDTVPRLYPGKDSPPAGSTLPKGKIMEHYFRGYMDDCGEEWFKIQPPGSATFGYIPYDSCEIL